MEIDITAYDGWGPCQVWSGPERKGVTSDNVSNNWSCPQSFPSFPKLVQCCPSRLISNNSLDIWNMFDKTQLIDTGTDIVHIF